MRHCCFKLDEASLTVSMMFELRSTQLQGKSSNSLNAECEFNERYFNGSLGLYGAPMGLFVQDTNGQKKKNLQ